MGFVVVQMGHCYRRVGATGTSGHRGSEQQFAHELAHRIAPLVVQLGHRCELIGADDPVPASDVFIALHQDGSTNPAARGASVGYPAGRENELYAATWKAKYAAAGWQGGFRADNYTMALRNYYGFKRTNAKYRLLMEHGFATNRQDCDWMWDRLDAIARVHADTVAAHLGSTPAPPPPPPPQLEEADDAMNLIYIQDRDFWFITTPAGVFRIGDWSKVVFWRDVSRLKVVMMDPQSFDVSCGPVVRPGVL